MPRGSPQGSSSSRKPGGKSNAKAAVPKASSSTTPAAPMPKVVLGQVDCAAYCFPHEEDARVYADVEQLLEHLQSKPTTDALAAVQSKLTQLAGYPTVVAVVAGRYPLLFSALARLEQDLGVATAHSMAVAGVAWDVWCRNTWLANACAVEDIGDQALSTLAALPALLRSIEQDSDEKVNEVWSVLHVLAWALRCSAMGGSVATLLESCDELWRLVEVEVLKCGRHVGVQLVLLDLLSALALHVAFSAALHKRLLTLVAALTQLPLPVHFHTAVKLYYACAVARQEGDADDVAVAHEELCAAWARLTQQSTVVPPALQAAEWIVGPDAAGHLETAAQLQRLLRGSASGAPVDAKAVTTFHNKALELPLPVRAFCVHALPGNPVLWLHRALVNTPKPALATAVVEALADVVLEAGPEKEPGDTGAAVDGSQARGVRSAYAQLCLQQLWVSGLSVSLSGLLNRRDPAITAAVVRLLQLACLRTPRESSTRRVLLGSPSLSLVADVLSGIADSSAVKEELKKKAVCSVVEGVFALVCAMDHRELASVFSDSLVMATSTLISEGKDVPAVLQGGLRALAQLAAAFPMAASMALDFEFLAEQSTIADAPAPNVAALVVGSLDVMSAMVAQQPAAVTFEWIEILLGILQRLDGWREKVPGLDTALWRCVRCTVEASEDCNEYLFTEETHEVLRNELERVKYAEAHHDGDILPSLLAIAACMQPYEHASINEATYETLARVPATQWTPDSCDGALRFLAVSCTEAAGEKDAVDQAGARRAAAAAVAVLSGAEASHVRVRADACDEFARGLSERRVAADAAAALFDLALDAAAATPVDAAKLRSAAFPLLHRLLATCPSARAPALAEKSQRLLGALTAGPADAATPALLRAALQLVEDTCDGTGNGAEAPMQETWSALNAVFQQAKDASVMEEAWLAVQERTCVTALRLFVAASATPIAAEGDPRVAFIGAHCLPRLAVPECMALVQTALNYDTARASLRRDFAAVYGDALNYLADPGHHATGMVPLAIQRYLGELKE